MYTQTEYLTMIRDADSLDEIMTIRELWADEARTGKFTKDQSEEIKAATRSWTRKNIKIKRK